MSEIHPLVYRHQYFLSSQEVPLKEGLTRRYIGTYVLDAHPELSIELVSAGPWELALVGDVYHAENPAWTNREVLEAAISEEMSKQELLQSLDHCCGSFWILACNASEDCEMVFTDMAGSREFYYHYKNNEFSAASQPKPIANRLGLPKHEHEEIIRFFKSGHFSKRKTLVGTETEFEGVNRLKPNHYLDLKTGHVHRYFPNEQLGRGKLDTVAEKAAMMIRGFVQAVHNRHKLAIPVSAGWESRIFLAASKPISSQVAYYVYKHPGYADDHIDVKIPKRLADKLGIHFNVITYEPEVSQEVKDFLEEHLSFPRFNLYNYLINGLHEQLPDHSILNGNISEIARMEYDDIEVKNGREAAHLIRYPGLNYATRLCQQWYDESADVFDKYGYRVSDMLYWEEPSCNWVAKANTETRMVTEVTQPFNCRHLIRLMLTVDKKHRRKQQALLYKKIIGILWSECLSEPINPSPKKRVIGLMQSLGIYGLYRNLLLRYQLKKS